MRKHTTKCTRSTSVVSRKMLYITVRIVYRGRYGPTDPRPANHRCAAQRAAGVGAAADVDAAGSVAGTDHPAPGRRSEPRGDGAPWGGQPTGGVAVGETLPAGRPYRSGRC